MCTAKNEKKIVVQKKGDRNHCRKMLCKKMFRVSLSEYLFDKGFYNPKK